MEREYDVIEHGILEPEFLDTMMPWAKALVAAVGWMNSGGTTVAAALWVEQTVWQQTTQYGWIVGIALAVLLSAAQVFTKDRSAGGYLAALLPDVAITAWQHYRWWLRTIWVVLLGPVAGVLLAVVCSIAIGWWSARLPERMMFGKKQVVAE